MSTPNQNQKGNNQGTLTLEQQVDRLRKIACTAYSISGYEPTESGWELIPSQICDIVNNTAKSYLEDVSLVTLDYNQKNGSVHAFVWIPRNSRHLCDNELNANESAIKRTRMSFSQALKEFMNKYCEDSDHRIYSEENNMPLAGIRVRLENFMKLEFDENNIAFRKAFGAKYTPKTRITLTPVVGPGKDDNFGKFKHLAVVKSKKSPGSSMEPRPKKSYNAR